VIEKAHELDITDLDFNPNKQYYFLSAGEDCTVRFWDLRKP
jgi:WD40 repeat protein